MLPHVSVFNALSLLDSKLNLLVNQILTVVLLTNNLISLFGQGKLTILLKELEPIKYYLQKHPHKTRAVLSKEIEIKQAITYSIESTQERAQMLLIELSNIQDKELKL